MAEAALFSIAGGIINGVAGPLAALEVRLSCGAKGELEKLTHTLSTIKAVIADAEEQQAKSKSVRLWLERLSDLLYEADDLLDAVSTKIQRRKIKTQHKKAKRVRIFLSRSNQFVFRLKMAHKIKSIREKLDAIADDMKIFQFVVSPEEPPVTVTRRDSTYSFVTDEEVIGRESDKGEIIKRLLDTNVERNVSILPIVGIGGLGKTTLAQYVYNDEKIQTHFELRMWIRVSDPFNLREVVEKLSESVGGKKSNSMDVMINDLKAKIDKKKYLLVLDDVWNEDAEQWSNLERVLIGGTIGSKILVTTRSELVAKTMFLGNPYNLEGLAEQASLNLLKRTAFWNGEWPKNPRIEELGREIIKKCAGVPLAVKTVGRMLHFKNSEREWLNFVKSELLDIQKDKSGILTTLKFSYNKLPSHLKCCFAYCSIHPKDHKYDKTTIIYEWIAHGFIESPSTNQCLEDVGNVYFMDLLWRSFFQDPEENVDKVIIKCKMHDLMHDLAASITARSLITTSDEKEWKIKEKTRHLSICDYLNFSIKELISRCEERMIRTFHCPNFGGEIDCETIFSSFKFLRVLNLRRNNLEHVPNTIGKLKHLRYLDLSQNEKIKVLPHSCTKLVNLQFLNLSNYGALKGLPRGIKNLVNLRCLNLYGCSEMTFLSYELRKSTSLQWLKQFQIDLDSPLSDNASLSEFKELNKLEGSLIIWNLRHSKYVAEEYKVANIKEKTGLKSLKLHFSSSDEDHDNDVEDERLLKGLQPHANLIELEMDSCRSVRLPSWIWSITSLVELRLHRCNGCQYLPHVNYLRSLKLLYLSEMNALVYISDDGRGEFSSSSSASTENAFPSLSKINLSSCPNLKGWWRNSSLKVDHDSKLPLFPQLSEVWIKDCPMLTSLPLSPQLCLLKKLHLEKMATLEYLFDNDRSQFLFSSLASIEDFYSLVSEICFEECLKLKGWWKDSSLEVDCDNSHYNEKVVVTSIDGQSTFPLFPQLSKVRIINCPRLTSLPLSPQSHLLKEVVVHGIDGWEYVFANNWCDSLEVIEAFWPSLSKIKFNCCSNLKGWWKDFSSKINCTLPLFPKLSHVDITHCPLLTSSPLSPHIESLALTGCPAKLLEQIMMEQMPTSATNSTFASSSYAPLTRLKEITLCKLSDLEALQEEWLKNLTSLKDLQIYDCLELKSLSLGILHLTSLKDLFISNCPKLEPLSDKLGKCWEGLKSLLYLRVENLSKWVSLPLGLQQVSTLRKLDILGCENLTTILESIHHWKSLKEVEIWNCPHLKELPEGIFSLSSLQKLEIKSSPELLKFISPRIEHLTALKSLTIDNCSNLDPLIDEHGMCWEGLKSLLLLRVKKLLKWVSLPSGLQQVSTLRALYISECESLTTILESIHHWKSLEVLGISSCPRLTELPEGIQSLSSLRRLLIRECPILLQKYKRDGGVDWPKIAHIPKLELDCSSSEESDLDRELHRMERLYLY